ncbi:MAG: FHA domain-containing protein [archaeon]|nr:FHA domain-containing protein [archaeon]
MSFFNFFKCCTRPENQKANEANVFALSDKDGSQIQNNEMSSSLLQNNKIKTGNNSIVEGKKTNPNNSMEQRYSFIASENESKKEESESKKGLNSKREIPMFEKEDKLNFDNPPIFNQEDGPPDKSDSIRGRNKNSSDLPIKLNQINSNQSENEGSKSNRSSKISNSVHSHISNSIQENEKNSEKEKECNSSIVSKDTGYDFDFNTVILDEEIEIAPKFIVEEKNKCGLLNGKIYHIDAGGEKNSPRSKRDGIVLFGPEIEKEEDEYQNDIIVNLAKKKTNLKHFFAIYYNRKKVSYFLQNMNTDFTNNKFFIYAKIRSNLILDDKYLGESQSKSIFLILGEVFVSISLNLKTEEGEEESGRSQIDLSKDMTIKIFTDKKKQEFSEYHYDSESEKITIGREGSTIEIENKFLSRIHCCIYFNKEIGYWVIEDGDGDGKKSTHGTWLFVTDKYMINTLDNEIEFKIGSQCFTLKLEE